MAQVVVSFLAIIDPVGNILVFQLFSAGLPLVQKTIAASIAVGAAFFMLLIFALAGRDVLDFLGITEESFKVAAGLLLLPPAYSLVTRGQPQQVEEGPQRGILDYALVPMATPLIAGPGALAAATSYTATAGTATTLAAIAIVLALTFVSLVAADVIFRFAGDLLLRLMSRVVGILLFAIAVDFVLDGLRQFVETTRLG